MTAVHLRFNHVRVPFRRPYVTAAGSTDVREVLIVRLENDSGVIGLGEGSLLPHEQQGFEQMTKVAELAARLFLSGGVEALDRAQFGGSQVAGLAAVETAVRDALARADGLPLATVLNREALNRVEVNALVTAVDIDEAIEAARELAGAGYRTIKLKVGTGDSPEAEVVRIRAVRDALSRQTGLRLDANGAWAEAAAATVLSGIGDLEIEYLEQPIAGDLRTMRVLREASNVPIAADEDVSDIASARRAIESQASDVLVLKPIPLGGISRTLTIAEETCRAGLSVALTTSIDTGIGTAVALHLAAAVASSYAAGLATASLLESDLLRRSLPVERGAMAVPEAPGLGVEMDQDALAHYTLREWVISR